MDTEPPLLSQQCLANEESIETGPPARKDGSRPLLGSNPGPKLSPQDMHQNRIQSRKLEQIERNSEDFGSSEAVVPSHVDIEFRRATGAHTRRAATLEAYNRKSQDIGAAPQTGRASKPNCQGLRMPFGHKLADAFQTMAQKHLRKPR